MFCANTGDADERMVLITPGRLTAGENALAAYVDSAEELNDIVFAWEGKPGEIELYYDMATEHLLVARKEPEGTNTV